MAHAAKYSQVEGNSIAISPGVRTIPAPIVLPMATAIPKPTPSVLISRPRPASRAPTELDLVAKESSSPCVKTKSHHSRARRRRKRKLPKAFRPQRQPRIVIVSGVPAFRIPYSAFRAPGGPLAPILTILTCLLRMAGLPIMNWIRFFVWLAVSLVIYFSYSRKRITLRKGSGVAQS